MQQFLTFKTFT